MRTTLESGSGAWIEHVPFQDLKGKHIRLYARAGKNRISGDAVSDDGDVDVRKIVTEQDLGETQEIKHDALWAIVITAWSYDFPVPVFERGTGAVSGSGVLDEIPADDYEAIDELLKPYAKKLAAKPNPKGATTSGSNGSSRARASGSHRG
jgi:hypothetical protein